MAKENERKLAKQLFIQGKNQKEIAVVVNVRESTVSSWVAKYGWKAERDARLGSSKNQLRNIKSIISSLAEQRIELQNELKAAKYIGDKELTQDKQKEIQTVDNGAAYWNKILINIDKENRVSLSVYLDVMDALFKALQEYNPKLYMKTLEFQEEHLSDVSIKLS